jgi:hypothetical protein
MKWWKWHFRCEIKKEPIALFIMSLKLHQTIKREKGFTNITVIELFPVNFTLQ